MAIITQDQDVRGRVTKFLQGRHRDEMRQYVWKIIERLEDARKNPPADRQDSEEIGWVRVRDLLVEFVGNGKMIKNPTTLHRLLDDLSDDKILEKLILPTPHEKGRHATFYRTQSYFKPSWWVPRETLEDFYDKHYAYTLDLTLQLLLAEDLLKKSGCPDPSQAIQDQFKLRYGWEPAKIVVLDDKMPEGSQQSIPLPATKSSFGMPREVLRAGPLRKISNSSGK